MSRPAYWIHGRKVIHMSTISRRKALGATTAGLGLPLLAACGNDGSESGSDATGASDPLPSSPSNSRASEPTGSTRRTPAEDGIATSEVPVGGGVIEGEVVITQPTEGEFKAFTAICTHQGCLVGDVAEGTINCPCHASQFSIEDGSVVTGPAPTALAAVDFRLAGGRIVVG